MYKLNSEINIKELKNLSSKYKFILEKTGSELTIEQALANLLTDESILLKPIQDLSLYKIFRSNSNNSEKDWVKKEEQELLKITLALKRLFENNKLEKATVLEKDLIELVNNLYEFYTVMKPGMEDVFEINNLKIWAIIILDNCDSTFLRLFLYDSIFSTTSYS